MRKSGFGVSKQVDIKRAVQPQKMATDLKFSIYEEEGLYYLCSENSCAVTAQLICAFIFAIAKKRRFSHDAAQLSLITKQYVFYTF